MQFAQASPIAVTLFCLICSQVSAQEYKFEHFSFVRPDPDHWKVSESTDSSVRFTRLVNGTLYLVQLAENYVRLEPPEGRTAKAIADDYRELEQRGMEEFGVKPGMYELIDLVKGEKVIAGKLYYTMTYSTKARGAYQSAMLFLYFPEKDFVKNFLVALYSESATSEKRLGPTMREQFYSVLSSVQVIAKPTTPSGNRSSSLPPDRTSSNP